MYGRAVLSETAHRGIMGILLLQKGAQAATELPSEGVDNIWVALLFYDEAGVNMQPENMNIMQVRVFSQSAIPARYERFVTTPYAAYD